ncbi:hypothetical protein M9H77_18850 [Catharanthus roseus]|uniref:Uncharacterized protein n=1 Tax=Catharanthus roseus TaxID=4058 RepID=A0ACC0B8R7_CATRO|nr:hypothetical protein M9H77_18850 [Catharanthus roseus]
MADNWKNYGGGRGSGGGGGGRRGGVRGGNQQNQYARQGGENYYQGVYDNHGSGSGGRRSGGGGERGGNYEYRYVQNQGHRGGEYYQGGGRGRGHDSYGNQQQLQGSHDGVPMRTVPQQQYHLSRSSVEPAGKMAWTGSQWGQDPVDLDIQSLDISEPRSSSLQVESQNKLVPIIRPDQVTLAIRRVRLLANHFRVQFNPANTIIHMMWMLSKLPLREISF